MSRVLQSQVPREQAGQPVQAMLRRDPPLQHTPVVQSGQKGRRIGDPGAGSNSDA